MARDPPVRAFYDDLLPALGGSGRGELELLLQLLKPRTATDRSGLGRALLRRRQQPDE